MFGFLSLLEKRKIYFMIPLYKMFRTEKSIETESVLVVAVDGEKKIKIEIHIKCLKFLKIMLR